MAFLTRTGAPIESLLMREPQSTLGSVFSQATYQFFLTGTTTPANVYQDGALTSPFPITGFVQADTFGRFPAIYLDPSITYLVQFFDGSNTLVWTVDPYVPSMATTGTSSNSAFGLNIATTGEVTLPAPNVGGTGITLTLNAGSLGSAPLAISAAIPGNSALIINNSVTTGAHTATFTATNKPGTAASTPAGWLPITCDGVQYYTPIWHGNNFTPYVASPSASGEIITGKSVLFSGSGITTSTGGTATPGNWFSPSSAGIGAGFWINITKTAGLSGLAFSAAQGAWTNITSGGLTISSNAGAQITGTYKLSSSVTGSPVVASGTITLSGNNGVQGATYNGLPSLTLAGNGTATVNGASASSWFTPTTTNTGSGFWINITRTGGTAGVNFTAAQGAWTNITNAGLSIGINGSGGQFATGTYQISSNAAGTLVLGSGSITLTNSNVLSPNWSGRPNLIVAGNGTATLNGVATSPWFSPTTTGVGAGYWLNITRTGGTTGVNFTTAQGIWANIGSGGLTINISGYTGDVGTVSASGTWKISNSSTGSPVLGTGSVTLTITGLTAIHVYTSGSGSEPIPVGTTNVTAEAFGSGGGGGGGAGTFDFGFGGGGGGSGAYSRTVTTAAAHGGTGKTFNYVVGAVSAPAGNGFNSTITAGTVTSWGAMTAGGGFAGGTSSGSAGGTGGAGGTASGGTSANTSGHAGGAGTSSAGGAAGAGLSGTVSGDGSPHGAGSGGSLPGRSSGTSGAGGAVVFFYT